MHGPLRLVSDLLAESTNESADKEIFMLDVIAILSSPILFGLSIVYALGCDRLKGSRL